MRDLEGTSSLNFSLQKAEDFSTAENAESKWVLLNPLDLRSILKALFYILASVWRDA
jgi:hypothetical protein